MPTGFCMPILLILLVPPSFIRMLTFDRSLSFSNGTVNSQWSTLDKQHLSGVAVAAIAAI